MTEIVDKDNLISKSSEIELFNEKFEGNKYSFIIENREIYMTPKEIGKVLEYIYPKRDVEQIIERHIDEFKDKIKMFPAIQSESPISALNKDGILLVGMLSHQPKATKVREWILEIVNKYDTLTSTLADPIDQIIATSKLVTEMATRYKQIHTRLDLSDTRQLEFDEKQQQMEQEHLKLKEENSGLKNEQQQLHNQLDEKTKELEAKFQQLPITPAHRDVLKSLVTEISELIGQHYSITWATLEDEFKIPKPQGNVSRISLAFDWQFDQMHASLQDWQSRVSSQSTLDLRGTYNKGSEV